MPTKAGLFYRFCGLQTSYLISLDNDRMAVDDGSAVLYQPLEIVEEWLNDIDWLGRLDSNQD